MNQEVLIMNSGNKINKILSKWPYALLIHISISKINFLKKNLFKYFYSLIIYYKYIYINKSYK